MRTANCCRIFWPCSTRPPTPRINPHGNERVLRARFNDARFFWQTDQKQTLRQRVDLLRSVTFQKDLGSYYDKTMRVQHLASSLAETVRQNGMAIRPGVIHKAALLAKTDLTTELVKEFTELQELSAGSTRKCRNSTKHKARRATGGFARHLRSLQARIDGGRRAHND